MDVVTNPWDLSKFVVCITKNCNDSFNNDQTSSLEFQICEFDHMIDIFVFFMIYGFGSISIYDKKMQLDKQIVSNHIVNVTS